MESALELILSPALVSAIHEFYNNEGIDCSDGDVIANRCDEFSQAFAELCQSYGIDACCVWYEENRDNDETFRNHCVVEVEGVLIDWTYRQFDLDAYVPEVWHTFPWGVRV
jgi:hypothetical protein